MATTKKSTNTTEVKENVVDVSQFFSMDNEENGVWFEPIVNGISTGIEVLVYGPNSETVWEATETYSEELEKIEEIKDAKEKRKKENELLVKSVMKRCGDIRGKNGSKLVLNGKVVCYEDLEVILKKSPAIAIAIWNFALRGENFLGNKKNS